MAVFLEELCHAVLPFACTSRAFDAQHVQLARDVAKGEIRSGHGGLGLLFATADSCYRGNRSSAAEDALAVGGKSRRAVGHRRVGALNVRRKPSLVNRMSKEAEK